MKHLFYPLIIATALVATACTNSLEDEANVVDPSNKTAISFVGQNNTSVTRAGFAVQTQIAMHIRSTKDASNIRETRTWATAQKDETQSGDSYSNVIAPADDNVRYWDDAYGRDANLSVFAVAIPGKSDITNDGKTLINHLDGTSAWSTGVLSESIAWEVSTDQTDEKIADEDLTFSNNISKDGKGGVVSNNHAVKDGYLKFRLNDESQTNGPGKFDQGNLKFSHALSRITVNLIKGTGYGDGSFNFATGTNIKVLKVPTKGSLNLETGLWSSSDETGINTMATTTKATGVEYSLVAQVLPGYVITDGEDDNVLEFIIDDNKYFITQDMMFDALASKPGITESTTTTITMEKGRNYVFNITVGKSKIINVTATLEPWINVTATDQTMNNSHITLDLFTNTSGSACDDFDLYRLNDKSADIYTGAGTTKNWGGNYTDKANLTKEEGKWVTDWFFEDNKSFYHFRTVDKGTTIKNKDNDEDDYFVISSGVQNDAKYHWGAPFVKTTTSPIKYNKVEGYADFLSPAIGATNSTINLTELHMRSNINVVLQTTKTSNAVALESGTEQCEVSLTYFYADGQVKMGNGLVTPVTSSLTTSAAFTAPAKGIDDTNAKYNKTGAFSFAVVPQALVRTSGTNVYVGITIKTPDNNQYYVVKSLAEITATANGGSQNQALSAIDFWYPNHSYTYTFTLTKAGIKDMTCTVEDWINVTADNKNITLED